MAELYLTPTPRHIPSRDGRPRWRRRLAALLAVALVCLPLPATADDLPALGGNTGGTITAAKEREIGQRFLAQARERLTFVHDREVLDYVRTLGYRVSSQTDFHAYPFHFYVVKDSSLNAFAVPGGHIFVHSGLVETARTPDELAGVLAHEVAHITQRHMARQAAAGRQTQLSSLLLIMAGILAGMQGEGEAAEALVMGAGAYSQQEMLAYSRAHEREADRLGIKYLTAAGFDPEGLPGFLKRLQSWSQLQGATPAPYLSTHPLTQERVADARSRASQLGKNGGPPPLGADTFRRIQARLEAGTADSPEAAYDLFRQRQAESPEDPAARYGLALAAERSGRTGEALRLLRELVEAHPEEVAYRQTLGEILLQADRAGDAAVAFRGALDRRPESPELRRLLGQARLAQGRPEQARRILLELTRDHPDSAAAHHALAEAYSRLDRPVDAHREEAEARWLAGERASALEQLRLAERLAKERGSSQLPRIRARIQELEP